MYGPHGWQFGSEPGTIPDTVNGKSELVEIYLLADPKFTGRVTVPALWDKERGTIVNNESAEMIRMFNSAFGTFAPATPDYHPQALRAEIDSINSVVYGTVTMASTEPALPPRKKPMRKRFARCSRRLTRLKAACHANAITWAHASPKLTGGCSPR